MEGSSSPTIFKVFGIPWNSKPNVYTIHITTKWGGKMIELHNCRINNLHIPPLKIGLEILRGSNDHCCKLQSKIFAQSN